MMIKSLPQQTVTPSTTSDRLRMIKQLLDISLCLVFWSRFLLRDDLPYLLQRFQEKLRGVQDDNERNIRSRAWITIFSWKKKRVTWSTSCHANDTPTVALLFSSKTTTIQLMMDKYRLIFLTRMLQLLLLWETWMRRHLQSMHEKWIHVRDVKMHVQEVEQLVIYNGLDCLILYILKRTSIDITFQG